MINGAVQGKVHWPSVVRGLQPACALSFLYLIRCALHSAALMKNLPSLGRTAKHAKSETEDEKPASGALGVVAPVPRKKTRMEKFSEIVDIEDILKGPSAAPSTSNSNAEHEIERAKPTTWTLQGVLIQYGVAQVISACIGSFGIIPSVATSHAMFAVSAPLRYCPAICNHLLPFSLVVKLRAERVAPQLGSFVLISVFYLTDFRLITYVPKMAFSCLLSLAFIDIVITWAIKSYFKTKEKSEWFVVPIIVVFAFAVGLLEAVFLGIALSTFIFVAAFFRSGVVKFAASGKNGLRSTIERPASHAVWLDENGDLIQAVLLQNFLFFGNSSMILTYISSLFETPAEGNNPGGMAPLPKYIVLDMAL